MENTENYKNEEDLKEEKVYSKKDFDEFKANLENEFLEKENQIKADFEKEAKKSQMSELELARSELEEIKKKYQQKEDECLITKQKEEANELLKKANLDSSILDVVYAPKDLEKTKENIETLKTYIEKVKQQILQDCIDTPVPLTSKESAEYDPFIEGFDTNEL